ncbi:peptide deformylase [Candidatus Bipolaricaulota bacterium]|jgi:peptide deformylase|nr:peptide deformylase [Candidatus Bipolaricaulota bacterium]
MADKEISTQIVTYGDPVLRRRAAEVANIDSRIKRIATAMAEAMMRANGVGLAAPQIGISERIIALDIDGEFHVLINPEIVELAEEEEEATEGCLSVPGIDAPVSRRTHAVVRGYTLDEQEITLEGEGLMARAIQHEIDHLNGVLFIDHLTPAKRRFLLKEYARLQREKVR